MKKFITIFFLALLLLILSTFNPNSSNLYIKIFPIQKVEVSNLKILDPLELENYFLDNIEEIEIREYKELVYASFTPESEDQRNMSFRNIAPYIFGENSRGEKIEMTSPVVIKMHNNNEMAFIMPNRYELENLPKPHNNKLELYEEKSNIKAVIRYS